MLSRWGVLNITLALGFGIALLLINSKLFMITLLVVMIFCVFTMGLQNVIKRMNYAVLQNNSKMVSIVEESIQGIEFIKTDDLSSYIVNRFKTSKEKYFYKLSKFANLSFSHNNIATWIASFGSLVVLYIGIVLCGDGEMRIDTLLIYYIILSYFLPAIQQLVYIQPEISEAIIAIERVEDVLGSEVDNNHEGEERFNIFLESEKFSN